MSKSSVLVADAGARPTGSAGALMLGGGGKGSGWGCGLREKRFAAPFFGLDLATMCCISTLVSGVLESGLMSGTRNCPSPILERLSIHSTSALLKGELERGPNTRVLGEEGGVLSPGAPIGPWRLPHVLRGGKYSKDASVPSWPDAASWRKGNSGS